VGSLLQSTRSLNVTWLKGDDSVTSVVLRDALGELDRQLEQLRDVRQQLEAEAGHTTYRGGGWEEPAEVLPHLLTRLYETLLVLLEVVQLPQTRERLVQEWQGFTKREGGVGYTEYDPRFDYMESKPLTYLETLVDSLRIAAGQGIKQGDAFELAQLERLLRRTAVLVKSRGVVPQGEIDVQRVMHDYLDACFTEYHHPVSITGVLTRFEPDGGVRNLQAAIEFKYADTETELKTALRGIFEDISGYSGSKDWTRFYTVIYQTDSFEAEDRFKAEMTRAGTNTWTPILVTGKGNRQRKSVKGAPRKNGTKIPGQ
jgi:hypothetical protein